MKAVLPRSKGLWGWSRRRSHRGIDWNSSLSAKVNVNSGILIAQDDMLIGDFVADNLSRSRDFNKGVQVLERNTMQKILVSAGFKETRGTQKVIELTRGSTVIYLKKETKKRPLVVHPDNHRRLGKFLGIRGVRAAMPLIFYHNANMREFPDRLNNGKNPTKYGIDFEFDDRACLLEFLARLDIDEADNILEDLELPESTVEDETERQQLKKSRLGQGKFRDELMVEFESTCPLTGVSIPELLRASHIKPWRHSSNKERLERKNGLLLAAGADALFDKGFISFDRLGALLLSKQISMRDLKSFGLRPEMKLGVVDELRAEFLEYHRRHVFLE